MLTHYTDLFQVSTTDFFASAILSFCMNMPNTESQFDRISGSKPSRKFSAQYIVGFPESFLSSSENISFLSDKQLYPQWMHNFVEILKLWQENFKERIEVVIKVNTARSSYTDRKEINK